MSRTQQPYPSKKDYVLRQEPDSRCVVWEQTLINRSGWGRWVAICLAKSRYRVTVRLCQSHRLQNPFEYSSCCQTKTAHESGAEEGQRQRVSQCQEGRWSWTWIRGAEVDPQPQQCAVRRSSWAEMWAGSQAVSALQFGGFWSTEVPAVQKARRPSRVLQCGAKVSERRRIVKGVKSGSAVDH